MAEVRPRSVRGRVTLLSTAATTVVLVAAALLLLWVLRQQLADNLDEALDARIDALVTSPPIDLARLGGDEDVVVQLIDAQGRVLDATPGLAGSPIAPLRPGRLLLHDLPARSETFRVQVRPVAVGGVRWVVAGMNHDDVSDPVRTTAWLLAAAVPLVVAALAVLAWWLIGRALRPVEQMRAEMAQITAARLDRRIALPPTGDEVARLGATMNEALDRLEDAVRRQQRFVADASHELRGPLTRIRSDLEVDLRQPELSDPIATERRVLEEAVAIQHLVDDLLQLARSDAGATTLVAVPLDLDDLVLREARRLGERGRVEVDASRVSAASVDGDPDQLRRAIRNLLDNAERHAARRVSLSLTEAAGVARMEVANDGPPIPDEQREHIFERFTRLDETRTSGGVGLGLAISRDIATRHGGSLRLADARSSRFVLELPLRR